MTNLKSMIAATAASLAVMAPLAGAAEADYNGFRKGNRHVDVRPVPTHVRGPNRRYDHRAMYTPRIDMRIATQGRRIRNGRLAGRLTRFEAIRLRGRLFAIKSARSFARIDGVVTFKERRRLMVMLDDNSHRIRRLAHNGRVRGSFRRY